MLFRSISIPVIAIVGSKELGWEAAKEYFKDIFEIKEKEMETDYAISNVKKLLENKLIEIFS